MKTTPSQGLDVGMDLEDLDIELRFLDSDIIEGRIQTQNANGAPLTDGPILLHRSNR